MKRQTDFRGDLTAEKLLAILRVCGSLPDVKKEVVINYADNRWWPLAVTDWRLRLLIAGWSSRISYQMIGTFRQMVEKINQTGYETLCTLTEEQLYDIIRPIGLFSSRLNYFLSLQEYIPIMEEQGFPQNHAEDSVFIQDFSQKVNGAGYKVAQCALLYARGYHCGIFPVDSGLKDMLGPCLGLKLPAGPAAHEVMRLEMESLIKNNSSQFLRLFKDSGFSELGIPANTAPVWWAHLVLIYFKRLYCNRHDPQGCPLVKNLELTTALNKNCK